MEKTEVLDLRIALTAGAAKNKRPNHSSHVLPTPIPQITPIDDESDIML